MDEMQHEATSSERPRIERFTPAQIDVAHRVLVVARELRAAACTLEDERPRAQLDVAIREAERIVAMDNLQRNAL